MPLRDKCAARGANANRGPFAPREGRRSAAIMRYRHSLRRCDTRVGCLVAARQRRRARRECQRAAFDVALLFAPEGQGSLAVGASPRKTSRIIEKAAERRRIARVMLRRRSAAFQRMGEFPRGLAPTAKFRAPLRGDARKRNTQRRRRASKWLTTGAARGANALDSRFMRQRSRLAKAPRAAPLPARRHSVVTSDRLRQRRPDRVYLGRAND